MYGLVVIYMRPDCVDIVEDCVFAKNKPTKLKTNGRKTIYV